MRVDSEPFGNGTARIIHAGTNPPLPELPAEDIRELFKQAGVLMFRGFDADPWLMKSFAERFSSRFNRDQSRPPVEGSDGYVQMVTEGMGYVEPHSEQANSPFRPDAIWFCCTTPSARGGETLFWDGVALWQRLRPELRELFQRRQLRFFQRYTSERWKLFLGPEATLADVQRELDGVEGASYYVSDDESIYLEYVCPAVVKTRYGGHLAFANSLLLEYRTLERRYAAATADERAEIGGVADQLMAFHDGSPISGEIVSQIQETAEGLTEQIVWHPGDLAVIDNTRFLHGRNAFTDTNRRMFSSVCFLNF